MGLIGWCRQGIVAGWQGKLAAAEQVGGGSGGRVMGLIGGGLHWEGGGRAGRWWQQETALVGGELGRSEGAEAQQWGNGPSWR